MTVACVLSPCNHFPHLAFFDTDMTEVQDITTVEQFDQAVSCFPPGRLARIALLIFHPWLFADCQLSRRSDRLPFVSIKYVVPRKLTLPWYLPDAE